jgi:hypothetical protein
MNLCRDDKKATKKTRIINASCAMISPAIKAHAVRERRRDPPQLNIGTTTDYCD